MTENTPCTEELLAAAEPGSIVDLPIPGAWAYVPKVHGDGRGSFHESFKAELFGQKLGYPFEVAQGNLSRSSRDVVRGIHLADVPPGQAKLVSCLSGAITDVLVDVRVGSPTFGQHITVELSAENNVSVYVPLGVGHGFRVHDDQTTVNYLVTEAYNPQREYGIDPFDADLAVAWGVPKEQAVLSDKDKEAPSLSEVRDRLPQYREVRAWEAQLRADWAEALHEAEQWEGAQGENS